MTNIQIVCSEKDVEDVLCQHSMRFLQLRFLARQCRTPVGVIDILARHPFIPGVYYVIEVKRARLDPSAYVQVCRYARWLNSERAKDGRRVFIPMLVGESLSEDLTTVCEYFDHTRQCGYRDYSRVCYRLFKFDPLSGVSFAWQNNAQCNYTESLQFEFDHYDKASMHSEFLEQKCYDLEEELVLLRGRTIPTNLTLVK